MEEETSKLAVTGASTEASLREIARRCGTPTYAYDLRSLQSQAEKLRSHLPAAVDILYSLKANASLGVCEVLADCGIGADVASAGEILIAVEAGYPPERIFVAGPYKSPETIAQLRSMPEAIISIDSPSELELLARQELPNRAVLRLRPDFDSSAVVAAGPDCRFGVLLDEVAGCRQRLGPGGIEIIGFHVFAGSQVLAADGVVRHLRSALDLSLRAAERLGISPEFLNLGGGFGVPYKADEQQLDLAVVGQALDEMAGQVAPARLVLELGRYLVAQAGWYLTSVVGYQTYQGRPAVVVDGGTHQRADLCGLGLRTKAAPPLALDVPATSRVPTDVLGCLSLPADVLVEACPLPFLPVGTVLAFANAGAYGLWASATNFHGYSLPAEVVFDGATFDVIRSRRPASSILDGQAHVLRKEVAAGSL